MPVYVRKNYIDTIQPYEVHKLSQHSYDELLEYSENIARQLAVPYGLRNSAYYLLSQLKAHDKRTAKECLQALPLALEVARVYSDFYSVAVNLDYVWLAALLHDIGKTSIPKSLINKSNRGLEWTEADREQMMAHVDAGYRIAREHDLPMPVCRAIAEHHHKQLGVSYGPDFHLNNVERIIRDSVAIADFTDADLNRTNTRNVSKNRQQRLAEVKDDIMYVFSDYSDGQALAGLTYNQLTRAPWATC